MSKHTDTLAEDEKLEAYVGRLYESLTPLQTVDDLTSLPEGSIILTEVVEGVPQPVRKAGIAWVGADGFPKLPALLLVRGVDIAPVWDHRPVARARNTDPGTSHAAADSMTSSKLRANQEAVLSFLRRSGSMTDEDLVAFYDGPQQSDSGLRTRRKELFRRGLVVDTGLRRPTISGRSARVWAAVVS